MTKKRTTDTGRSAPQRGRAATDQSPVASGAATTSEEVVLAVANDTPERRPAPSFDEIAEAAYRRYLDRGGSDGQAFEDWIEAERELTGRRR